MPEKPLRDPLKGMRDRLRQVGMSKYLFAAVEIIDLSEIALEVDISILKSWKGVTDSSVENIIKLLLEFGTILKILAWSTDHVEYLTQVPLDMDMDSILDKELNLVSNSMVVRILYRDNEIAFGEVPVTTALYNMDIRAPMIYACAADTSMSYIIGLLGTPPPLSAIPLVKDVLNDMEKMFEKKELPRRRMVVSQKT
ncbi:MAG: hypothetical protein ACFFDI_10245 [Promethearchaeota archaeon]